MKMRILLSVENFWPRLGGGEVFVDEVMTALSTEHKCKAIYVGTNKPNAEFELKPIKKSKVYKNIPLVNRLYARHYFANKNWKKILEEEVKNFNPNLIITQLEYLPASVDVAQKHGIKTMGFLQNYEHFCPNSFKDKNAMNCSKECYRCSSFVYKAQFPFAQWMLDWHKRTLKQVDHLFADSEYVKNVLKRFYDIDCEVMHPVLSVNHLRVDNRKQKYITFINPVNTKGADLVLEIVDGMPNEEFMVVGGKDEEYINRFKRYTNVEYKPWVNDMKDVYKETKLLLVPSVWPEPFGKVVLEAQTNGIPVISSNVGGLPEAVGEGGTVLKKHEMNSWISAIEMYNDKEFYKSKSEKGVHHVERLLGENGNLQTIRERIQQESKRATGILST